jgi:hypothetical protein
VCFVESPLCLARQEIVALKARVRELEAAPRDPDQEISRLSEIEKECCRICGQCNGTGSDGDPDEECSGCFGRGVTEFADPARIAAYTRRKIAEALRKEVKP